MNINRTGGDYRPTNLILTDKKAVVPYKENGSDTMGQSQVFFVRKDNSYTDKTSGALVEKQPLDWQCTTFDPTVIQILATLQVGAAVNLVGWIEPSWRGYVADNTVEGDTFVIPDTGRKVFPSPKGRMIQPDPHPYRMIGKTANVDVKDVKQIRVTELTPANAVTTQTVEVSTDPWAQATGNAGAAPTATSDPDKLAAAQKQLAEAQAALDAATADAADTPAAANPAEFTQV